jgi:hypothetical protein
MPLTGEAKTRYQRAYMARRRANAKAAAALFAGIVTMSAALWTTTPQAQDVTVREIIASTKFAGTCATLLSAANFAEKTNMPGGREFVQRFWANEAARAGETPQSLLSACRDAFSVYSRIQNEIRGNGRAENAVREARLAGVCVVLSTMANFASKAKMPGSPAFVNEFWAAEISSTGRTSHGQFVRDCEEAAAKTEKLYTGSR